MYKISLKAQFIAQAINRMRCFDGHFTVCILGKENLGREPSIEIKNEFFVELGSNGVCVQLSIN